MAHERADLDNERSGIPTHEEGSCSLISYFTVRDNELDRVKGICRRLVARTRQESKCLFYAFTFDGHRGHCRGDYKDSFGLMAHLDNVGGLSGKFSGLTEVQRIEVHAPENELETLREALGRLKPRFFATDSGFRR